MQISGDETNQKIIQAKHVIETLYRKYENEPYMFEKTHHYICNQLPNILNNIKQTHEQRVNRIEELSTDQDIFIQSFLENNHYFYIPQTEKFFFYDGIHYQQITEDDIIYNILSSISRNRYIMSWKQKTKITIMKKIKEKSLLKTIPESETIQFVLDSLCPTIFSSKNECKYFLTILGDNILRKRNNLIHYIDNRAKQFLQELNNNCQLYIGCGLTQTFRYKYHDHSYQDCRLININDSIKSDHIWYSIIQYTLDILCVACHYSTRYSSSDEFVELSSNDSELIENVFYLKKTEPENIIMKFINEYLDIDIESSANTNAIIIDNSLIPNVNQRTTQITWKNMQYLWKQFLDSKNLPPVMFYQTLKTIIIEKLEKYYNKETDCFIGICSRYLPAIHKFLQFWNETIIIDDNETEFEIEELVILFRKWSTSKNETISSLNDKQILDLIIYFFPNIEIEKDKYISGIRCSLWDKQMDIQIALDHLKESIQQREGQTQHLSSGSPNTKLNVSIYDTYIYYCRFQHNKPLVSKSYFEKYIFDNLSEYVIDAKFISVCWYLV